MSELRSLSELVAEWRKQGEQEYSAFSDAKNLCANELERFITAWRAEALAERQHDPEVGITADFVARLLGGQP